MVLILSTKYEELKTNVLGKKPIKGKKRKDEWLFNPNAALMIRKQWHGYR